MIRIITNYIRRLMIPKYGEFKYKVGIYLRGLLIVVIYNDLPEDHKDEIIGETTKVLRSLGFSKVKIIKDDKYVRISGYL